MKVSGRPGQGAPGPDSASDARKSIEARVDEASKLYEKQFLREMVKAMRQANSATGFVKPSMGESIYREQLDEQYVEAWGDRGGIGLHQVIFDQLMAMALPDKSERPKGPIPLTDRDVLRSAPISARALRVELAPPKPGSAPSSVNAAMEGRVARVARDGERMAVAVDSSSAAGAPASRTTYVFEGAPAQALKEGDSVKAGDSLGILSPDAKSVIVNVRKGE